MVWDARLPVKHFQLQDNIFRKMPSHWSKTVVTHFPQCCNLPCLCLTSATNSRLPAVLPWQIKNIFIILNLPFYKPLNLDISSFLVLFSFLFFTLNLHNSLQIYANLWANDIMDLCQYLVQKSGKIMLLF